ncbi:VCBS repeat-containing protein [Zooshikella marina]|uniref:FG-GAP repeat domain-containing protein n=1 Tax=Zooshikella ganghwensis TaxID=202772 RepID=UPI001BB0218E|nr:VCBS repeat-containing protein [Zooshikella ganghwensis]MBU2707912.1 VCBS repeat-containing protein [Zooshikella ganghwensis]
MKNTLNTTLAIFISSTLSCAVFAENITNSHINYSDENTTSNLDGPDRPDPKDKKRKPRRPPPMPLQAFEDVNGDGNLDKVIATHMSPRAMSVTFLGNGDGSFCKEGLTHNPAYLPKKAIKMVNFADLTNDGRVDKIVTAFPPPKKKPRRQENDINGVNDKDKPKRPPKPKTFVYLGQSDGSFAKTPMGVIEE